MKKMLFAFLLTFVAVSALEAGCATGQCPYKSKKKSYSMKKYSHRYSQYR